MQITGEGLDPRLPEVRTLVALSLQQAFGAANSTVRAANVTQWHVVPPATPRRRSVLPESRLQGHYNVLFCAHVQQILHAISLMALLQNYRFRRALAGTAAAAKDTLDITLITYMLRAN